MMETIQNLHLLRPLALLLIPVCGVVWWAWYRAADPLRGWREQIDPALLEHLVHGERHTGRARAYLLLAAWLIGVLAIAGPSFRPARNPLAEDTQPLLVLMKADVSMDATDLQPSRMERAQLKLADLAKTRSGEPLGLIAYAGSAHLVLPPTKDTDVVAQMGAELSPAIMPVMGDRLDLAITKAMQTLRSNQAGGSLLIMADSIATGADNLRQARRDAGSVQIQLLSMTHPDSAEATSLKTAAKALNAHFLELTPDNADVETIAARSNRRSAGAQLEAGTRWEDAGYYLVPLIAILALLPFWRESNEHQKESA